MAQQLQQDEAGNIWDTSTNPPRLVQPAQASAQGGPQPMAIGRPDPYKASAEARANQGQDFQRQQLGLSEQSNARSAANDAVSIPQQLRNEYNGRAEVKEYRISSQQAMAALNTANNPQGDLALTYAFAKAMDPGSVVRDQEQAALTNTQPWFQSAVQAVRKQFGADGAGQFTPQARAAIRQEIIRNLATRKPLYDARRAELAQVAQSNGLNPADVVGRSDTEIFAPAFRQYAQKNGDQTGVISSLIGGDPIQSEQQVGATGAPSPLRAAGFGATEGATPIPEAMQQAHSQYLAQNWGKIDPQDYAAFRINLDRQYGFGSNSQGYSDSATKLNEVAAKGGTPEGLTVPAVKKELSGLDQFRNNIVANPVGAGVASGLNSGGLGIPSLFAGQEVGALRDAFPVPSFVGELGGGLVGTGLAGAGLRNVAGRLGEGGVAAALANPLAADVAYGSIYGATQADDPLYGAVGGGAAGFLGNRVGGAVGRALPGLTGVGGAIREADRAVPSSQQLKDTATGLYQRAEASGLTASPEETFALADRMGGILSKEAVMSPTGRLSEVSPKVKEAYKLVEDYAGAPMTPQQIQTVRRVISDGLSSQEASDKRVARLLLNDFDKWTDATNPELASGLSEARGVASRYLQGDRVALAREGAEIRNSQFSNSGAGNAVRTDFRAMDRNIANGSESFAPPVEDAIREASRGTRVSNTMRNVGKFGFQHPLNAMAAIGGGGATAGPIGGAAGAGVATVGTVAQMLSNRLSARAGQVAENLAYGGPEYDMVLQALLQDAATRGGHSGAVGTTSVARALADYSGN